MAVQFQIQPAGKLRPIFSLMRPLHLRYRNERRFNHPIRCVRFRETALDKWGKNAAAWPLRHPIRHGQLDRLRLLSSSVSVLPASGLIHTSCFPVVSLDKSKAGFNSCRSISKSALRKRPHPLSRLDNVLFLPVQKHRKNPGG